MPRPANPILRDDILRVALRLVEHKGPAGITMREVAAALGYSATAIYQHFVRKEALLLTLKLQAGALLAEEMEVARRERRWRSRCTAWPIATWSSAWGIRPITIRFSRTHTVRPPTEPGAPGPAAA